jgi:hypothetical protein
VAQCGMTYRLRMKDVEEVASFWWLEKRWRCGGIVYRCIVPSEMGACGVDGFTLMFTVLQCVSAAGGLQCSDV